MNFMQTYNKLNEKLTKSEIMSSWSSSNISHNRSSSLYEVISGHYWPQFTLKADQNRDYVKLVSIRTLLRIIRLAHI